MTGLFKHYYPRVNTRITTPFLLMTVVVAGLGVFIVTQLVTSSIAERLNNQLLSSTQAATNAMVEIETEHLAALRTLVFTDGIPDAIATNDVETIAGRLAPVVLNNQLDAVVVYDSAATPIYRIGYERFTGTLVTDPVSEDVEIASIGRVLNVDVDTLGDKFVDVVDVPNDTIFFITAPVVDEQNFIVGGISIGFRASNVLRRLTEQALANLVIYDQEGALLASSLRIDLEALRLSPDVYADLDSDIREDISPYRDLTLNEVPYRALYTRFNIRSAQIGLLGVALPADFVVERIGVSRNLFIVLFGGLFFFVIVIGLLVTRSIVQPINKLVDTARAIQEGDLSRRVALKQPDEIGELGSSFDKMAERLVSRNQQIEDLYSDQLAETARRDAILASIADAVVVRGKRNDIMMMNPAARSLYGEYEHQPDVLKLFDSVKMSRNGTNTAQAISVGDSHFSAIATPIKDDEGHVLGSIIVYRDISRLIQAEKLKDEMILQLSHELRTPLSSVRGYVELLSLMNANTLDQQSKSFMGKAMEQLVVLERMVNQVIEVSALLAEEIELEIEIFDLGEVVDVVTGTYLPVTRERYQRLTLDHPNYPVRIDGDSEQMADVLDHILRNAISYTPEGGNISVSLDYVDSQFTEIVVIDNGAGIAQDELPYVFDRLYRGRSADAGETDARGLGLGLFMSREIVEAHGGEITIDSEPGKGTIVTIVLPIKQSKAQS